MIRSDSYRAEFEKWLDETMGLQSEWQEERNCYKEFPAHLAWKAWSAAKRRDGPWDEAVRLDKALRGLIVKWTQQAEDKAWNGYYRAQLNTCARDVAEILSVYPATQESK